MSHYVSHEKSRYYGRIYTVAKYIFFTLVAVGLFLFFYLYLFSKAIKDVKIVFPILAYSFIGLGALYSIVRIPIEIVSVKRKNKILKEGELVFGGEDIHVHTSITKNGYGQSTHFEYWLIFTYYWSPTKHVIRKRSVRQSIDGSAADLIENTGFPNGLMPMRVLDGEAVFDEATAYQLWRDEFKQKKITLGGTYKFAEILAYPEEYKEKTQENQVKSEEKQTKVEEKPRVYINPSINEKSTKELYEKETKFSTKTSEDIRSALKEIDDQHSDSFVKFSEDDEKFVSEMYARLYKGGKVNFTDEERNRIWDLVDAGYDKSHRLQTLGGFILILQNQINGAITPLLEAAEYYDPVALRILGVLFDDKLGTNYGINDRELAAFFYYSSAYASEGRAISKDILDRFFDLRKSEKYSLKQAVLGASAAKAIKYSTYPNLYEFMTLDTLNYNDQIIMQSFLGSIDCEYRKLLLEQEPKYTFLRNYDFKQIVMNRLFYHYCAFNFGLDFRRVKEIVLEKTKQPIKVIKQDK